MGVSDKELDGVLVSQFRGTIVDFNEVSGSGDLVYLKLNLANPANDKSLSRECRFRWLKAPNAAAQVYVFLITARSQTSPRGDWQHLFDQIKAVERSIKVHYPELA